MKIGIACCVDHSMSRLAPPVVFLAFAHDRADKSRYLRNLPQEQRRVREATVAVEQAGLCEVVERANATVGEVLDVFQDARYRDRVAVFHFGGHAGSGVLLFESPDEIIGPVNRFRELEALRKLGIAKSLLPRQNPLRGTGQVEDLDLPRRSFNPWTARRSGTGSRSRSVTPSRETRKVLQNRGESSDPKRIVARDGDVVLSGLLCGESQVAARLASRSITE